MDNITCENAKTTSNIQPNAPQSNNVTTANVTVSVTCNAQVYDNNAIQTIAENALKQKASRDPTMAGYMLVGKVLVQAQPVDGPMDGPITFAVTAKGVWSYQWTEANKQALLNKIKGKTKAQAQNILNTYPGASNTKIDINNGGTTLPNDANQIKLVVNTVKGL